MPYSLIKGARYVSSLTMRNVLKVYLLMDSFALINRNYSIMIGLYLEIIVYLLSKYLRKMNKYVKSMFQK